ncbi:hypothetical protein I302_105764 [Kwoniella bestiolae CBS 10118]|uniref:BZIP domain-containing protein n=1 Tax=Kwoniella bestiolae CBS 10118 TaxID=1296100 RepID=A0A1B9G229_9TREE|nr:hypothetical protein I302_04886 [Kwoniella bestiolae CBS 10118]OCF25076.1 hypothetical protein I302_04886 [Kwoniella bestiolae CBS 10118]
MTRPIRDERRLAPLPSINPTSQTNLSLSCLADAALADALGSTPITSPHPKASFTLPPISALIAPLPTHPATNPEPSGAKPFLPSSGSTASSFVSTHTPGARSVSSNLTPAVGTDQPVINDTTGWSTSRSGDVYPSNNAHMTSSAPFPPPPTSQRPSRKEKQKKSTQSHARAATTSSTFQLEYNVRPYHRAINTTATTAPSSRQSAPAHPPTRTQPARSSKSKLPHPLQGLSLDKTYPERKVEDWHNDAQNLLRPPRPRPIAIATNSINHHTAAQSLSTPHNITPTTIKKIHPPVESWDQYALPQMPGEQPYLPQTQPIPVPLYPRPPPRRHQSSSSLSVTSWHSSIVSARPGPRSYTFVAEDPETFTRSRHRAPPTSITSRPGPYTMQRSQSAHTTNIVHPHPRRPFGKTLSEPNSPKAKKEASEEGKIGGNLPTPVTASMASRWSTHNSPTGIPAQLEAHSASTVTFQQEVLDLPQVQTPTPPLQEAVPSQRSPSVVLMDIDHQSRSPSLPPTRDITPIDQEMRNQTLSPAHLTTSPGAWSHSHQSEHSHSIEQPELEAGESSFSESESEPASSDNHDDGEDDEHGNGMHEQDDDHSNDGAVRLRSAKGSSSTNRDHRSIPNASSIVSTTSSIRARSSSHSTQTSEMIKYEASSSSPSSATSCFVPGKLAPKKPRTRSKAKTKAKGKAKKNEVKGKGRSKKDGSSVSGNSNGSTIMNGQRRNGERRREQNAVAQKRFRWKKKQMAAKMEADLESATALASSLQKQVAEKDSLVNKLKGEVGSLKRKLKTLEA